MGAGTNMDPYHMKSTKETKAINDEVNTLLHSPTGQTWVGVCGSGTADCIGMPSAVRP